MLLGLNQVEKRGHLAKDKKAYRGPQPSVSAKRTFLFLRNFPCRNFSIFLHRVNLIWGSFCIVCYRLPRIIAHGTFHRLLIMVEVNLADLLQSLQALWFNRVYSQCNYWNNPRHNKLNKESQRSEKIYVTNCDLLDKFFCAILQEFVRQNSHEIVLLAFQLFRTLNLNCTFDSADLNYKGKDTVWNRERAILDM